MTERPFGARVCGQSSYVRDEAWMAIAREDPSACFAHLGCPATDPAELAPLAACPSVPVLSVEDLVREDARPRSRQTVVVRGRLAFVNGATGFRLAGGPPRPCDEGHRILALEGRVGAACYAVDLSEPRCAGDASRTCCDHLPIGKDVAAVGTYNSVGKGEVFAAALLDSKLCLLPPASPSAAPSTSTKPP